jgi:ariadne-1
MKKYLRWHCKSFTDDNKNVKWCPYNQECEYAVERISDAYTSDVIDCVCGNSFCFKCDNQFHRPATCTMYKNWEIKNSSESLNLTWIIANTKPCPNAKCEYPIEKNQGCNHMICKKCGHEFCWMCMGKWKDHNNSTGGFYKCNIFEQHKEKYDSKRKGHEEAKYELNRYIFYFDRYNNHDKAEKLAREHRPVVRHKMT